jgi:CRISPR system Cascade subunit CasE
MFLHRIHLNPRCHEARRDLADPYQLHASLCRAFCPPEQKCPKGEFLWRLEPETDAGCPRILVQSRSAADWACIQPAAWLAQADPPVDLHKKLALDSLEAGKRFRFRLRANPCITRNGRRQGLLKAEEQEIWVKRKGEQHGFSLPELTAFDFSESTQARPDVRISHEQMLVGRQHTGNGIRVYSVLYEGRLAVSDAQRFKEALANGIGHAKALGLGLLSLAPL